MTVIKKAVITALVTAVFCCSAAALVRLLLAEAAYAAGEGFMRSFKWAVAETRYAEAVRLDPLSSRYLAGYADFLRNSARFSYDKMALLGRADKMYGEAIGLEPAHAQLWLKRGLGRLNMKLTAEAFLDFRKAAELDPHGYDVAYAAGRSGLNVWQFLDGENKKFVVGRLRVLCAAKPWDAGNVYTALWKASEDFSLLKAVTPAGEGARAGLYDFMAANNLWQFRKEAGHEFARADAEKIKRSIMASEKLEQANAWQKIGGKTQLAEGGEGILAAHKALLARRGAGRAGAEDWVVISGDPPAVKRNAGVLWSTGSMYALMAFPAGKCAVRIRARGSRAMGGWPYMIVAIEGDEIGEAFVDSAAEKEFIFSFGSTGGEKLLGISFVNDAYDRENNEDRNLWVTEARVEKTGE